MPFGNQWRYEIKFLRLFITHLQYCKLTFWFPHLLKLAVSHLARATASTDSFSERIRSAREAYHIAQKVSELNLRDSPSAVNRL